MKYRFENSYTQAESVKWQIHATSLLGCNQSTMSGASALIVIAVQFSLWTPLFYFMHTQNVPFVWMAPILFLAYLGIGMFYDAMILPHVSAAFDKDVQKHKGERFNSIIEGDEDSVRSLDGGQEITFKWDVIQDIHDSPSSVVFLTERGYCLIPARCFDGFLAKDAFVRDCIAKIKGKTEQGAIFA